MRVFFVCLLFSPSAFARSGGDDPFGAIVGVAMLVGFVVMIFVHKAKMVHQDKLIEEGKAVLLVKVSATGRVYHSMACGKCKTGYQLTEAAARLKGYSPCATCGGRGKFHLL